MKKPQQSNQNSSLTVSISSILNSSHLLHGWTPFDSEALNTTKPQFRCCCLSLRQGWISARITLVSNCYLHPNREACSKIKNFPRKEDKGSN